MSDTIENHAHKGLDCINCWLELFDTHLATTGREIVKRPLDVAFMLIDEQVISIKGIAQKDVIDTQHFRVLFQHVKKWYEEKYGQECLRSGSSPLQGVVLIYRTPFLINIPLTVTTKNDQSTDVLNVYFPKKISAEKDLLSMVLNPPAFATMPNKIKDLTKYKIKKLGSRLRSIYHNTMLADVDKRCMRMRDSIVAHLSNSARYIMAYDDNCVASAYWEIQLALEKSFKIFLYQRYGTFAKTHNLPDLYERCGGKLELGFGMNLMKFIPADKEIINYRYYGCNASIIDLMICYKCCLSMVEKISYLYKRTLGLGENTCFYVRNFNK